MEAPAPMDVPRSLAGLVLAAGAHGDRCPWLAGDVWASRMARLVSSCRQIGYLLAFIYFFCFFLWSFSASWELVPSDRFLAQASGVLRSMHFFGE